jgi:hypothetical protein
MAISTIDSAGINQAGNTTFCTTSGSVGIGTSSPAYIVDVVKASAGSAVRIWDNTTSSPEPTLYLQRGTNATWGADAFTDYKLMATAGTFTISGGESGVTTERMRIDSSGNLLVGTTSSGSGNSAKVLARQTSSGGYAVVADAVSNGGTYYLVGFQINGSTLVGQITSNGTTTTYATSSDYRLKENIAPMTGALNKVALLKPVTYKWKSDGSDSQGFIAHELQAVVPDCVVGEKDAVETYTDEDGNEATRPVYQGIDTSFLVATLTAAIQELKAIVDAQAVEIAALKGTA